MLISITLAIFAIWFVELLRLAGVVSTYRLVFCRDANAAWSTNACVCKAMVRGLNSDMIEASAPT